MSREVAQAKTPARGRKPRANWITFPRELREAIPDQPPHDGRVLELAAIDGRTSETRWMGPRVHLNLLATETGKLKGKFTVRVDLEPNAARALADALVKLADEFR